ncbi:MAG: hypothetical protein K0R54_4741 [Clostridiaceae bacterium]|jgi:hypothetical protein|nr:hypothetical protein [Clostridiaceae bacterium]
MRKRIILVTIICFFIVLQGFLIVSNRLDQFIKDKSDFSLTYKISPLELKIDTKKYIMDISENSFYEFTNNKWEQFRENINKLNTSKNNVFNNAAKDVNKITEVIYDTFNGSVK